MPDLNETNENMSKQKRFMLDESELPRQWYNIAADMPNKPLPPLNPATKEPLTVEELSHIFAKAATIRRK